MSDLKFYTSLDRRNLPTIPEEPRFFSSYTTRNLQSDPKIFPGYQDKPEKPGELRNQTLKIIKGHMVRNRPDERLIDIQIDETERKLAELRKYSKPFPTISQEFDAGREEDLAIVLCYFAYFQESVTESNLENYRVRYVRILRYLEDGTWMIEEHPTKNSQIPQGKLLRRGLYEIGPIKVGEDIVIHEVVFHVYDCDDFTRYFLSKHGETVAPREQVPDDLYTLRRKLTDRPIKIKHVNTDKTNLRNFLDYDGKVLRFWACWDDREAVFGEKKKFHLHLFPG